MTKYLFVYRRGRDLADKMTPEQMQQSMQKWQAWMREAVQKGWMLNIGDGLLQEGRVVRQSREITDGPYVEAKEIVGGYSIVQAETIDEAAEYARGCPALLSGGSVEVRGLAGFSERMNTCAG